jgi:putative transposase
VHTGESEPQGCELAPRIGPGHLDFTIEIVKRSDSAQGFELLLQGWVVERPFAWATRWRRLVCNYEERIDVSEAMIHIAQGGILLGRIAHE